MRSTRSDLYYYDVFVSFKSLDTRLNFTQKLFSSLRKKGLVVFKDENNKINKGESIAPKLVPIRASQIFIVVFSKDYASSTLCLQELEYILHCAQVSKRRILPVFIDVLPSEVRKQSGNYKKAFSKHEERFKHDSQIVRRWREALTHVSNLSGWDVSHKPLLDVEIKKIVKAVTYILDRKFSSVSKDLVGTDSPIEELLELLHLDSVDNVRVVGICGMDGIGKTTLATILYEKISHQFEACFFIKKLNKTYRNEGPIGAYNQILHQTLGKKQLQILNPHDAANLILSKLHGVRALIILDSVDQMDKTTMNREWLGAGSRIILISTHEHVLKTYGVDAVYNVPLLDQTNSLQLFCQIPSKYDHTISSPQQLEKEVLNYAKGIPLVIKVLGSFLFERHVFEWRDAWREAFARFRESSKSIMDVLRLSFDVLDKMEKEIFLDIACFFNGREEDYVKNVLNRCGFYADTQLIALIDKSLISISDESKIEMHALLEDLGRKINEDSSKKTRKWSRLWMHKQFYNVMLEKMENNVEAIVLHGNERDTETLMAETLSNMGRLRLLILKDVKFVGSLKHLSNQLKYVSWNRYPFMYLPSSFQPDQLVELVLIDSNIKQLWEDNKNLPNLKTLDLSYSENLVKMSYFEEFPNLEKLNLEGCVKLVEIDPSIGLLRKLIFLNLKNCKNLICIPNKIFGLPTLKYLNIRGCSKAFNNPSTHEDFASSLLPPSPNFSCLSELDVSFCSLREIPDALGCLNCLERINLRGNNFVTLPSLLKLSKLEYLNLEHCKQLKSLNELPTPVAMDRENSKRTGMYIFNCPELGNKEQFIISTTFSWMMRFVRANQYYSAATSFHQVDIVIPGSEIPTWFNNRRTGRSISVDPSPFVYDDNITGIVCCVAFSVAPFDPTTTRHEGGPVIRLGFKSGNVVNSHYAVIPVTLYRYLIKVKSNHMWIIYFAREFFISLLSCIDNTTLWDLDCIKMEASITNGQGLHMEVMSCGYSWVCKQDLQPFLT